MDKQYYVYIMTNDRNTVIYTGVTNNLERRVSEHKTGVGSHFSKQYLLIKLVYFEETNDIHSAIAREKQIKAGSRKNKVKLIESVNKEWKDLAASCHGIASARHDSHGRPRSKRASQ